MAEKEEKPKIIVDDDWKAQAQEEKEKLSDEIKAKTEAQKTPDAPKSDTQESTREGASQQLPQASFATLANMLLTNAVMALGGGEDPTTKKRIVDMPIAKFYIDNLEILQEKTKGNLTEDESKFLEQSLYELRMNFVHILESVQKGGSEEKAHPKNEPTEV